MLEIFEILDRFELIHADDSRFSKLRRLYIDKDYTSLFELVEKDELRRAILEENWHSIFRLVTNKRIIGDVEDLRKAILEQNIHSLFRLLAGNDSLKLAIIEKDENSIFKCAGNDDIRKLVLDDNIFSLFRLLAEYSDSTLVNALKNLITNDIEFDKDCLSRGQLQSKLWLIDELKKLNLDLGIVFLCAGWYGILATMMLDAKLKIDKITTFDVDESCEKIANIINKPYILNNWTYKHCIQDIHDIRFDGHIYDVNKFDGTQETIWETPNTVINTSTEHIENYHVWYHKIPEGTICIFQGNNYFEIPEHVNCCNTLEEFSKYSPMAQTLYEGELNLGKYTRFMKIGIR